ncbi:uncharacterized protein ACJ7VT_005139 [Polymixia lowei]
MRFLVPIFLFLAVAGFHTALTASLESAEKQETIVEEAGELSELQKRDQMEFEAAQMNEEQHEDSRYLEAVQDEAVKTEEGHVETEEDNTDGNKALFRKWLQMAKPLVESTCNTHYKTLKIEISQSCHLCSCLSSSESESESESESSEDIDGMRHKREHHETETETMSSLDELTKDATKEQDVVE